MNRARRRRGAVSLDEVNAHPVAADCPERAAMSRELAAKLDAARAELPDEQRETIVLHPQGKLPFRELE